MQCSVNARRGQWTRSVCREGGVQRGCQRAKYWPPTSVVGNSSKGRCGKVYRVARVQAGMIQGRNRKWEVSGLKIGQRHDVRGNVATLRPTSRRSREESVPTSRRSIQRRDIKENVKKQRRDVGYQRRDIPEGFKINVATFKRMLKKHRRDVGYQRRDIPEGFKINVATLDINVTTFQGRSKSTLRR